jgi:DNA (cytosine-5)-methyltransferase 1
MLKLCLFSKEKTMTKPKLPFKVVELFAGVGGFRLGLEGKPGRKQKNVPFEVIWSNQWEPGTKAQHASDVYAKNWGEKGHSNEDIATVEKIPQHDLLVGGFPCQDYSVARTLSHAAGIGGKKGVLWWQIHRIIEQKEGKAPSYLMLENVDRLLKSPVKQRGRDFAIMLASLRDLGYIVEWRVINAADYGMPQRRRRIFIMGYKKGTSIAKRILKTKPMDWILLEGVMAKAFPVLVDAMPKLDEIEIKGNLSEITEHFNKTQHAEKSPFHNAGFMINGTVHTASVRADYEGPRVVLRDVLLDEKDIPEEYYVREEDMKRWTYFKGGKKDPRETKEGFAYTYNEGPVAFPDPLDKPSRTIITGEGGPTPSRFKHVVKAKSGKLRRLTPVELERLNMFPDDHTAGVPDTRRAFFMGNALVVGVIERLGKQLIKAINA